MERQKRFQKNRQTVTMGNLCPQGSKSSRTKLNHIPNYSQNPKCMMQKVYRTLSVSVVLVLLTTLVVQAQQRVVTGTIKDPSGSAMPGVSILLKGTSSGTAADSNGNFSLQATDTDVLVISFIGYQ